jgi:hypothetical protein
MSEHKKQFRHSALLQNPKELPPVVPAEVHSAPVDEVQIPRPVPVPDAAFLRVIETIPVVARAWQRMERQYKAYPYEEAAPQTVIQAAADAAQGASDWNISQGFMVDQLQVPPHAIFEALEESAYDDEDVTDVPVKTRSGGFSESMLHTRVLGTPLPSGYKPERSVYVHLRQETPDCYVLECAWRSVENGVQLIKEHCIELLRDDPMLQERLQEMRTLLEPATLYVWDVPALFKAVGGLAHERFQPLYQWLRTKSLLDITKTMYQVGTEQLSLLTVGVLSRRFRLSPAVYERSRARGAVVLMLCHENIVREVTQLQEGKTVVPLDLRTADDTASGR